jgi:hypothetical protein
MNQIAEQVGCSRKYVQDVKGAQEATTSHLPTRVTGKDGKSYPASRSLAVTWWIRCWRIRRRLLRLCRA